MPDRDLAAAPTVNVRTGAGGLSDPAVVRRPAPGLKDAQAAYRADVALFSARYG